MVQRHARYTHSELGWRVLAMWDALAPKFIKVMPKDYRRMLEAVKRAEAAGLSGDDAVMVAFEDNKNDAARVSGN
jgi:glutamate synthase (ferredoxin)